jgi:hypothetical protein
MQPDSPLVRVRKARCRISEQCGNDPKRLVEYYMELQKRHRDRLVRVTDVPDSAEASGESDRERS